MIGRLLGGRYTIIENIDSGGMAYVYKAVCKKTGSIVAVKVLKEKFACNSEYVSRFKKEAEAAFSLEHRNIVHVTDIGCDDGLYYIVMEYVEGRSLKTLIEEQKVISEKEAIQYAIQICSALEAAHSEGIIHRDIKPENILLSSDGQIKITDFGIATSMSSRERRDNQVIGSVYYISPEQAKGDKVDYRTDIYSLGIVLYEMLTGVLPHTGDKTVAIALKHINEKITAPAIRNRNLSKAVNNIVLKATSKSPKDRYHSADDFRADLKRALDEPDGAFVDVPHGLSDEAKEEIRRRNKIWKACVLLAVVAIVGGAVFFVIGLIGQHGSNMARVYKMAGISVYEAQDQLKGEGLTAEVVYEASETIDKDIVISQSAAEGAWIAKGSVVKLTVSSGPAALVMPNVVGMKIDEAQAWIQSMGLNPGDISYEYIENTPQGNVISQMPEEGSEITEDVLISLVVSGNKEQASTLMPQVSGMTLEQAVRLLKDTGFAQCIVYEEESDQAEGTVIEQTPGQGIQWYYTDEVDLWVSEFSSRPHLGEFNVTLDIPEIGSKVRVVLQESLGGNKVYFVVHEAVTNSRSLNLNLPLASFSAGKRNVILYVNNTEFNSYEVMFY